MFIYFFGNAPVFEVSDVGRGTLAISKLLALKKFGPFLRSTYYWMSRSTFLGGGGDNEEDDDTTMNDDYHTSQKLCGPKYYVVPTWTTGYLHGFPAFRCWWGKFAMVLEVA